MLRTASPLLFLLFAIVAAAQTAPDFTARYGYPDAEKFLVRPEITRVASYSENHYVCEILIDSTQPQSATEQPMATATVSVTIDELIPQWQRGVLLNHSILNMGAAEEHVFEYENVTIHRHFVRYLPAKHDGTSATIIRKDKPCGSSTASQENVSNIELTATDLHLRYGDPVAQRLRIRPDVSLAVTYDQDQTACELSVGPTRSTITRDESTKYMPPEVVRDIVNELLPDDRGSLLLHTVTKSGCNEIETMDYQNAIVSRFTHKCDLPKREIEG